MNFRQIKKQNKTKTRRSAHRFWNVTTVTYKLLACLKTQINTFFFFLFIRGKKFKHIYHRVSSSFGASFQNKATTGREKENKKKKLLFTPPLGPWWTSSRLYSAISHRQRRAYRLFTLITFNKCMRSTTWITFNTRIQSVVFRHKQYNKKKEKKVSVCFIFSLRLCIGSFTLITWSHKNVL